VAGTGGRVAAKARAARRGRRSARTARHMRREAEAGGRCFHACRMSVPNLCPQPLPCVCWWRVRQKGVIAGRWWGRQAGSVVRRGQRRRRQRAIARQARASVVVCACGSSEAGMEAVMVA